MRHLTMDHYLKHLKFRYKRAKRKDKGLILDEFCQTSGLHRKSVIRLLNGNPIGWKENVKGRKKQYHQPQLVEALKKLWLLTDQMCSQRLKVAIPLWLPYYKEISQIEPEIETYLIRMSERTIDRLLKPIRTHYPKRIGGTKPGSLLKQHIPVRTNQWDESRPGYVEADTVAHCGTSLFGSFVWSITLTDIYSGWTENGAIWNKGAHGVVTQIQQIEKRLPFTILGFDSDNGSEFLNHHLLKYFQQRHNPIQFTRSRPYHKGDNAHVEQKNWTHVRQLFGYYRFDNPQLVILMNDLYQNELSQLQNYFYPTIKLIDKIRIQSKIKKKYSKPTTPYQRLIESEHISDLEKEKLKNKFKNLNPIELKEKIEAKLRRIFSLIDLSLKKRTGTF